MTNWSDLFVQPANAPLNSRMSVSGCCFNSKDRSMQRNMMMHRADIALTTLLRPFLTLKSLVLGPSAPQPRTNGWGGCWGMAAIALVPLLLQPQALASPEALTEQEMIDQIFLTDTPLPGATPEKHAELLTIRDGAVAWLGNYQGVRPEADYLVIEFEHGEVPVTISLDENGESGSIGAQCPITEVPLSQAPEDFQTALAACPDLVR